MIESARCQVSVHCDCGTIRTVLSSDCRKYTLSRMGRMTRSIFFRTRLFSASVTTMRSFAARSSAALSFPRVVGVGLWMDSTVSTSVLLMSASGRLGFAIVRRLQQKLETAVELGTVELIVRVIRLPHGVRRPTSPHSSSRRWQHYGRSYRSGGVTRSCNWLKRNSTKDGTSTTPTIPTPKPILVHRLPP